MKTVEEFINRNRISIAMVIVAFGAFVSGYTVGKPSSLEKANYETLPYKIELIKAYDRYNAATETLLDFLDMEYGWDSVFCSVEYLKAREALDKVIWEESILCLDNNQ